MASSFGRGWPAERTAVMAAPLLIEERFQRLEARMTALEHLPDRIERLESQVVHLRDEVREMREELGGRIDDSRRETRLLHEDVLGRIVVIGEGVAAQTEKIASREGKITALSAKIDAARDENRLMFEQLLARVEAPRIPPKRKRR